MKFTIYSLQDGQVLYGGECAEPGLMLQVGQALIEGIEYAGGWIAEGAHREQPKSPTPHHTWDWSTKQWVDLRDLQALKQAKGEEINAARLQANQTSFAYKGQQIRVDPLSRSDIDGTHGVIVLTGAMPPNWIGGWKTVANTFVPIPDVATWTQFYLAMNSQGSRNFARSQALKARLLMASTPAQVAAIAWNSEV